MKILGRAAAAAIAAALSLFLTFSRADSAVRAGGLPNEWLKAAAERSLGAVWDHMPASQPLDARLELLRVVADRLLRGFSVSSVDASSDDVDLVLALSAYARVPEWDVEVAPPDLLRPVDSWFARDAAGMADEIAGLLRGVPIEALTWGDSDLKSTIEMSFAQRLPGWRPSLLMRSGASGAAATLVISFTPQQPLTLAVSPKITSNSIPVMLHSTLKDDLLKTFAPVIGLPVPWFEAHSDDVVMMTREMLESEPMLAAARATAEVAVTPDSLSQVDIDLESRRYSTWVWMAVYAGSEGRYPEAGLHFGRWITPFSGWDVELYGESIITLDSWRFEQRLGAAWQLHRNVRIGGEWSSDDDKWWGRVMISSRRKGKPYLWARISADGDANAAIGLRVTDFLSLEVLYDDRYDSQWNVRALINL